MSIQLEARPVAEVPRTAPPEAPPLEALLALTLALLLPLLFVPAVEGEFFLPRYALLPLEALVGGVLLIRLLGSPLRRVALAGLAFAAWACLSTALSPEPVMAVRGVWLWGDGLLFAIALVGMWAIGASAGATGRRLVEDALLVGTVLNAVLAIVETVANLSSIDLGPVGGRAVGLWGNPVWLGAFLAGGLWLACARSVVSPLRMGIVIAVAAAGIELSGSRSALAIAILVVAVAAWRARWKPGAIIAGCAILGVVLGLGCAALAGNTSSATSRATGEEAGGLSARVYGWEGAAHAIAKRPLTGEGPGLYGAATEPYRTIALAKSRGPERLYFDAHNLVVEYATTTGIPGLVLLLLFLVVAVKRAGPLSPLGGFAIAVFGVHLVEPQNPGLTVLITLALGAGAAGQVGELDRRWRSAVGSVMGVGAVVAGLLVVGGWRYERSIKALSTSYAIADRQFLPHWPETAIQVALTIQTRASGPQATSELRAARLWVVQAVRDDPSDESSWVTLGDFDGALGNLTSARTDFVRALALNPTSVNALNGLGDVGFSAGNRAEAARWWSKSLALAPDQPEVIKAKQQIDGLTK